jgi:nucleotide-binding universal stress UspA family protein
MTAAGKPALPVESTGEGLASWRPSRGQARAIEALAHAADEAADAAGLLLADAVLDLDQETVDALPPRVRLLIRMAADAKAEAVYRWATHADCLAQSEGRADSGGGVA